MLKSFKSLSERELLALAIHQEEEDAHIYGDFADSLRQDFPSTARLFDGMREEEIKHRQMLTEMYRAKFGEHIPLIRKQDIRGFIKRRPLWLMHPLSPDRARSEAESMETETRRFYEKAAQSSTDLSIRTLFLELAEAERGHEYRAQEMIETHITAEVEAHEAQVSHRLFLLQVVQPGLAGLMDGSVSTLAPLFAAAFATHNSWDAFLVGMAASIGAGISMGFAEALSDDGSLTGRGHPWIRGVICGLMTTIGGIGHTLPYLIPNFYVATSVSIAIVIVELAVIAWIRYKYMDTPPLTAATQIVIGGILVFLSGVLIGNS